MLTTEQIIATLASEHQIIINRDDPINAFLVVHKIILDHYKNEFNTLFETKFNELNIEVNNSKDSLNKVLDDYKKTCKDLTNSIVGTATLEIKKEAENLIKVIEESNLQHSANQNILSTQIYILIGISIVLAGLNILQLFL